MHSQYIEKSMYLPKNSSSKELYLSTTSAKESPHDSNNVGNL